MVVVVTMVVVGIVGVMGVVVVVVVVVVVTKRKVEIEIGVVSDVVLFCLITTPLRSIFFFFFRLPLGDRMGGRVGFVHSFKKEEKEEGREGREGRKKERRRSKSGRGAVSYTHLTLPTICSV
eukprot:TRINITY_DN4311_c0_g1_i2.p1 TRINITY_DN4311_c0_g1~~TRINITY_DN4311_c0_g1_i2.p1  ORF type:complete len:122 (-),score=24.12 TRINITY_DN4311_c0_g1_i2:17-382(-)